MKIEGSSAKAAGLQPGADARVRQPKNGVQAQDSTDNEKVEFSNLSTSLNKAEAAMTGTPVVDQARVDEIRQAIRDGRFVINAETIADKLLSGVREMLGTQIA